MDVPSFDYGSWILDPVCYVKIKQQEGAGLTGSCHSLTEISHEDIRRVVHQIPP